MDDAVVRTSKYLSFVLRHKPDAIGLALDPEGWASVDELIQRANRNGQTLTRDLVLEAVATNNKRRFALSPDGLRIRANQGHSIDVDLGLKPVEPPEVLYHGTASGNLDSIRKDGLRRGKRQHVHLSPDPETAVKVGQRHGKPVVILVRSRDMFRAGHIFLQSENGVWLTETVSPDFLKFPETPT